MRAGLDIKTEENNQEQNRQSQGRKCRETEETKDMDFKIRKGKLQIMTVPPL